MIRSTTAPGDALLLFADESNPEFSTSSGVERIEAEEPVVVAEPAHVRRRRLREERSDLVGHLARARGSGHKMINAWVNSQVGLASVGSATEADLERSIEVLRRELEKR